MTARVLNKSALRRPLTCDEVYIGRAMPRAGLKASKWANPFRVDRDGSREEVIARYEAHLRASPELMASIGELRGKDLVCWCAPLSCHGDLLLLLANGNS